MSHLAAALELMHTAEERFYSVEAVWNRRCDRNLERVAFKRHLEASKDGSSGGFGPRLGGTTPRVVFDRIGAWVQANAMRFESVEDGVPRVVVDRNGRRISYSSRQGGAVEQSSERRVGAPPPLPDLGHLLAPFALSGALKLEVRGTTTIAGRTATLVRGTPRPFLDDMRLLGDEHELAIDDERGVVLRHVRLLAGEPFDSVEMASVAFDIGFPPERFEIDLNPGDRVHDVAEVFEPGLTMPIDEAARRAPFTVLIPRQVPAGMTLTVRYNFGAASGPFARPSSVTLWYGRKDAAYSFVVGQSFEEDLATEDLDWTEHPKQGGVIRARTCGGQAQVVALRHDTWASLVSSNMTAEKLVEIADSLVPAPRDPSAL